MSAKFKIMFLFIVSVQMVFGEPEIRFDLPEGVTKHEREAMIEFNWGKDYPESLLMYRESSLNPLSNLKEYVAREQKDTESLAIFMGHTIHKKSEVEEISLGIFTGVVAKQVIKTKDGLMFFYYDYALSDGGRIWVCSMMSTTASDEEVAKEIFRRTRWNGGKNAIEVKKGNAPASIQTGSTEMEILFDLPEGVKRDGPATGLMAFKWEMDSPFNIHVFTMYNDPILSPISNLKEKAIEMQEATKSDALQAGNSMYKESEVEEISLGVFNGVVVRQEIKKKYGPIHFYDSYVLSDGGRIWICSLMATKASDVEMAEEILRRTSWRKKELYAPTNSVD